LADAATAALLVTLADLPALNDDDDDGTALPVFSLSSGGRSALLAATPLPPRDDGRSMVNGQILSKC